MDLIQIDCCKSFPYDPNPSGLYYWTSVYYADLDEFLGYPQVISTFFQIEQFAMLDSTKFVQMNIKNPPGRGNIVYTVDNFFGQGGLTDDTDNYSLIMAARWHFWDDQGRYSWRLNRGPIRGIEMEGNNLSDYGHFRNEAIINSWRARCTPYNSHGAEITRFEVAPKIAMWQLRHGTKRSRRDPLDP